MSMAIPPPYLLRQEFPLFTLRRTYNLHNSALDCTPLPLPLFNIFSGIFGSLQSLLQLVPLNTPEPCMLTAVCHVDMAQYVTWTWHVHVTYCSDRDPASSMPQNVNMAKTPSKEKSYKKYLESQCSNQWRKHLELTLRDPPGRVRAYVHWHLHNKHKRSMCKPAPYLTHPSCPHQLELLRMRTQNTVHIIPSHLHHAFRAPRVDYQDRVCPHCLDKGTTVLRSEIHIIGHCPATKKVLQQFAAKFQGLTRLLDLPAFASSGFTPDDSDTQIVLGNPPPQVLQKGLKGWITEATPICSEFAYALRMHVTSLHPAVVDMSFDDEVALSSDSNDDVSPILLAPILLPPGFQCRCPQMAPCLYLLTPQANSTYSSNGSRMDGVWARYQHGTPTPKSV